MCKNAVYFLAVSFPNKAFVFPNRMESAKHAFAARAGSGKPALLHVLFLENKKQNSRKNYGAMFSREVQGHMKKFNSFRGNKKRPQKSRTMFLHAHLQLFCNSHSKRRRKSHKIFKRCGKERPQRCVYGAWQRDCEIKKGCE